MNRGYVIRRVGQAALTLTLVVIITFWIIRLLPGDPEAFFRAQQVSQSRVSSGQGYNISSVTEGVNYDRPIWKQFVNYISNLVNGNLGTSIYYERPVTDILVDAIPWTIFIVGTGLLFVYSIGILLGAYIAYREGTKLDVAVSSLATVLNSIPYYVAGILLVFFLGYNSNLFPSAGRLPKGVSAGLTPEFILGAVHHAILPIISIVITAFGFRALSMRGNSIQILGEDFVRVANLRGLSSRRITSQYVARNAVLPMYTGFLIALGFLFGGSIVLERIFQYQGLGFVFFTAIASRDYPLMMGAFLLISIVVILGLLVADLTYGLIDPRASVSEGEETRSGSIVSFRKSIISIRVWFQHLPRSIYQRITGGGDVKTNGRGTLHPPAQPSQDVIFLTTSDARAITTRERYRRILTEYVVAPGRIIWNDPRAKAGSAILIIYLFLGTVGVAVYPKPSSLTGPQLVGPFFSLNFPLGTDSLGRDIFALTIYSIPPILKMMVSGALFATLVATAIGLVAGYSRGDIDRFLMFTCDLALAIPALPLVMLLAVVFEPKSPFVVGLLLAVNSWGGTGRAIRSQVLTINEEHYVEASGIMSLHLHTILIKDILPNLAPYIIVRFVQTGRGIIFSAVALYYLGVLPFTSTNWGVMLNAAQKSGALLTLEAAHWVIVPCIALIGLVYSLILLSQATDKLFNPRVRSRHVGADVEDEEAPLEPTQLR